MTKPRAYRPPITRRAGVTGAIAECDECPWRNLQRNALATGAIHARATGHQVHCVQELSITYNAKDGVNHKYEVS